MMTTGNRVVLGVAVLVALLAGFGLARVFDGSLPPLAHHHAEYGPRHHDDDNHRDDDHGEVEDTVVLTARQIEASGIRIVPVGRGGGHEARLTGRVQPIMGARTAVAAIVDGRVEHIEVTPGTRVEAGQRIAVVTSGDAATLRANADAATAEAEAARLAYRRDLNLLEQGVIARQSLEASRAHSLSADAGARAAQARVVAAGSPDAQGRVAVVSPIMGVVSTVRVTPGGFVTSGGVVADISDPDRTELVFTTSAALASQIVPGDRIDIANPAGAFEAEVVGVAADLWERNATAVVRARLASGNMPPVGSPVAGIIVTDWQEDVLTVPADAVQTLEGRSVVFVATDAGFRATPVLTGYQAHGRIEILRGLSGAERIAGANAFLLKAELAKGEAAHEH